METNYQCFVVEVIQHKKLLQESGARSGNVIKEKLAHSFFLWFIRLSPILAQDSWYVVLHAPGCPGACLLERLISKKYALAERALPVTYHGISMGIS